MATNKTYQVTLDTVVSDETSNEFESAVVRIDTDTLHKQLDELKVKSDPENSLIKSKHKKVLTNSNKTHHAASPIRDMQDIKEIKEYILNRPERYKGTNMKYYTYFVCGINNVLRISDMSELKFKDVLHEDGSFKSQFTVDAEKKTHKSNTIYINQSMKDALTEYMNSLGSYEMDDYIFHQRGNRKAHLSRQSFWNILNEIKTSLDLDYTLSCHSTRKTFVYQSLMKNKDKYVYILTLLQRMLNHSKQETTIRYCGLEEDDKKEVYNTLCL